MTEPEVIRAIGRFKLLGMIQEAIFVCYETSHTEYVPDFREIEKGLLHDHTVDYKEYEE